MTVRERIRRRKARQFRAAILKRGGTITPMVMQCDDGTRVPFTGYTVTLKPRR